MTETLALSYACIGVFFAGMCYFIMAGLIKTFGIDKIIRYFPPVVTGPMIIAIGLVLSGSAIHNCTTNWTLALVAILTVIITSVWGKGIIKIIPILLGVLVSYVLAAVTGEVDFSALHKAAWIGLPVNREQTALAVFDHMDTTFLVSTIIAIMPIAIATIMEHIGDMCAISGTVGKFFLTDPGLHRTLTGDGVATTLASLFGVPEQALPQGGGLRVSRDRKQAAQEREGQQESCRFPKCKPCFHCFSPFLFPAYSTPTILFKLFVSISFSAAFVNEFSTVKRRKPQSVG